MIKKVRKNLKLIDYKTKRSHSIGPSFLTKELVCDCYDAYYLSKIGNDHSSDLDISNTSGDLEISITRCAGKGISC